MRVFAICFAVLLLAGCAANQKRQEVRAQFHSTIPTCMSDKECEIKWAAARRWVISNAAMKLQHVESDFLETYNPPQYSASLAARVVKEPIGYSDGYRIIITTWCANLFGCVPDQWESALKFNYAVNASYVGKPAKTESTITQRSSNDSQRAIGKYSITAERLAKEDGCSSSGSTVTGNMIINEPGTETYQFSCDSGSMLIRCDIAECSKI